MGIETKFADKVVLIIEEKQALRDKARNFLLINKAETVIDAANFQEGYDKIPANGFDYCICDYKIFNTNAQTFIKLLRRDKKLENDDQLIMADDFYQELEECIKSKSAKKVNINKEEKSFDAQIEEHISKELTEIHRSYCSVKSLLLVKSTNQPVEATILNIDTTDLTITLSTSSMEELDNYARQIKFESHIEGKVKSYTIIGDVSILDDSKEKIRELELKVPEQYSNILTEIETDLFTAQEKTKILLRIMKGEL